MLTEAWSSDQRELEKWIKYSHYIINNNYKIISDTIRPASKQEPNPVKGTALIINKNLYRYITRTDRI
jgi:hypothetical protein